MTEPSGAVFLSYASEDKTAALKLCEALRAASIEVWFDQSELRGGDAWDNAIRAQIRACTLFVPIISTHTRARTEGYFRLEWKLAVDRSHLMAAERPFLVPVVIDDTPSVDARVPDKFREIQWTRLANGEASPEFVDRVRRLLSGVESTGSTATTATAPTQAPVPHRSSVTLIALAVLLIGALGYIAVSKRTPPSTGASAPVPAAAPTPPGGSLETSDKSIAVLPFTDLSEKKDQQYFSDGLSEELIDLLAQIPELKVTARTSSFSFRDRPVTVAEIGRQLSVANLLEGSVRKSGHTVRVTAQLVRADNGFHLWSATFERDLKDVFMIQDEIARVVVDKLKLTLVGGMPSGMSRTENAEAHNLLLQGTFALQSDTAAGTAQAIDAFQRALALEPGYAAAYSGIGTAKFRRAANGYEPAHEALMAADRAVRRAIELDPNFADALATLASVQVVRFDWAASAASIAQVLKVDPGNASALFIDAVRTQATGSSSEAIAAMHRALDRDPLNLLTQRYTARALYYAGRLPEAEAMLRKILAVSPTFSGARYELGRVLLARGDVAAAIAEFEAESNPVWRSNGLPLGYYAAHLTADFDAAMRDLLVNSQGADFQIAEAYAFTGQTDKAFETLNRALTSDLGMIWLRNDPLLMSLSADPRYKAILAQMKLPMSH